MTHSGATFRKLIPSFTLTEFPSVFAGNACDSYGRTSKADNAGTLQSNFP